MFTVKLITKEEIVNVQYVHGYKSQPYAILENDSVIAYTWLYIKEPNVLWLDMIEVIEKEQGLGTKIVQWLFEAFNVNTIEGLILEEERAYYFWESLGSHIYYLHEAGYTVDECLEHGFESPFKLSL